MCGLVVPLVLGPYSAPWSSRLCDGVRGCWVGRFVLLLSFPVFPGHQSLQTDAIFPFLSCYTQWRMVRMRLLKSPGKGSMC